MTDEYTKLLYFLAGAGVLGFVSWVVVSIVAIKTDIAVLKSKEGGIRDMKKSLDKLTEIVFEIAGKLGIPIRGD